MHEFDLIPADYREREQIQRRCKIFALFFVAILLGIVGAKYALIQKTSHLQTEIDILQKDRSFNLHQQQKFNELLSQERSLTKRLEVLDGLSGGVSATQIFKAIDRVLDGDVWFIRWTLHRAIEVAEFTPQSVQTNYIAIPEGEPGANKNQVWRLNTNMEIHGHVLNHSKLALFVSNLIKQPEIADVKVLSTSLKTYTATQVVDFKIVVAVSS